MKPTGAPDIITQITRRQWVLRLGGTVALAGVSGILPEIQLHLFGAEQQQSMVLPPGLYEPSPDHLVHALSSHKLLAPPLGSETDYVQPGVPLQLRFFSPDDFRTIASFVAILLGDVEQSALKETAYWVDLWFYSAAGVRDAARKLDPLHRALAAAYFGEPSVRQSETADPAAVAREGVAAVKKLCLEKHSKALEDLDVSEQQAFVDTIRRSAADSTQRKFFELVRDQVIRGYYTSAAGLKELDYKGNAYYPFCPGCESL